MKVSMSASKTCTWAMQTPIETIRIATVSAPSARAPRENRPSLTAVTHETVWTTGTKGRRNKKCRRRIEKDVYHLPLRRPISASGGAEAGVGVASASVWPSRSIPRPRRSGLRGVMLSSLLHKSDSHDTLNLFDNKSNLLKKVRMLKAKLSYLQN